MTSHATDISSYVGDLTQEVPVGMSVPSPAAGDKNNSCMAVFHASPVVYLWGLTPKQRDSQALEYYTARTV